MIRPTCGRVKLCSTLPVSALVRTYNRADYLGEALDSVLGQTRPPERVLVVDDGSDDATPEVLARFGARIDVLRLDHTGNPTAVLNAGLAAAGGEAVALLDSDDVWLPDKLERQLGLLAADERLGFVYGNACLLGADGRRSAPVLRPEQIVHGDVLPVLARDMCVHPSTLVVRRRWLDRLGALDERERANEDYFLLLRLARLAPGACVSQPVALIRQHPGQVSQAHGLTAYTAAISALEELLREPDLRPDVRRQARQTIARYHAHVARELVRRDQPHDAWQHARAALAHNPLHRPAWRSALAAALTLTRRG
jgi:glycosyl transferase family 2